MIAKTFLRSLRSVISNQRFKNDLQKCGSRLQSTQAEVQKSAKAWNDAACVMIVAPMNNSEPYSLGYLMVERSRTGRVMPGNWVFPGGNFDPIDTDLQWIELFKEIQKIDITQERFFQVDAHLPEIYLEENSSPIPKEMSLRITAVRETFEEAGILLCRPRKMDPEKHLLNGMLCYDFEQLEDKRNVQMWQKRVRKNSQDFIEMCRQLDCVPDIRTLHDWNNWLTPVNFKSKSRFDTMFYMTILPKLPNVVVDGNEATRAQWISPSAVLAEHAKGQLRLMPPQLYEFDRLKSLKTISELRNRLSIRKEFGIERLLPVVRNVSDGIIFILPGDDLYPDNPNCIGTEDSLEAIPKTVAQLRESCTNLHRGIAKPDGTMLNYEINVTRYGHMY